jgi:GH24 family phage-related lysozyme (muramidase)
MHQSVLDVFPRFTSEFEGRVSWMYLDIKGLVTIGYV